MKVLYLGTRGEGRIPLSIDREVDMLTRIFADTVVQFRPLPWVRAENLVRDLSTEYFEILHITAHGEGEALQVMNEAGATVMMTAEHISAFLPQVQTPRLVYLNACNSQPVAEQLAKRVPFAIGSSLPLANDLAIQGALSFYWRILLGGTVQEAFQAAHSMVGLLSGARAEVVLNEQQKGAASKACLMPKPRILAAIEDGVPNQEALFRSQVWSRRRPSRNFTDRFLYRR